MARRKNGNWLRRLIDWRPTERKYRDHNDGPIARWRRRNDLDKHCDIANWTRLALNRNRWTMTEEAFA